MGYYTGNGVVTSGGKHFNYLKTFWDWGHLYSIRQKVTQTVTRKPGVSLTTAQNADATCNTGAVKGGSGNLAWGIPDCTGTKSIVSYSQIGESNLYDLTITTEAYEVAKVDTGNGQNMNNS